VEISFDPANREKTLRERDVDFMHAEMLFVGRTYTTADDRFDCGETRLRTFGLVDGRLMVVIWTPRGDTRHVISMRKCNEREAQVAHRLV
jgi:uncharacterized protein